MKAVVSRSPGPPETLRLEQVPDPKPGRGEVLLAVKACSVNYPDVLIIQDLYQFKPQRPFSPGSEVCGVIEAMGEGVDTFKAGDRVIAMTGWGGMAEKLVAPADRCVRIADTMPDEAAASFILTYGTAYHALRDRAQLRAGEILLVLGAAGGVGLATVELGKAMGARVVAAASSPDKLALAKRHGAETGILYPPGPFDKAAARALADLFKSGCGPNGADVIFDPVGGDYAEAALRAVAWNGRFLVIGFPAGIPRIPLNLPLLKSCEIIGVFWGEFSRRDPDGNAANTQALLELYARGAIKPQVSERFALERAGEAIARLASRQAMGKIVVMVD
jgi:NADPH:quinone reductase